MNAIHRIGVLPQCRKLSPIADLGHMYIALRRFLFWIRNDDSSKRNIYVPHHFRSLYAILDIRQTMMSHVVGGGRLHTASFVAPFRLWNGVSIHNSSEIISTSGFAVVLILTV